MQGFFLLDRAGDAKAALPPMLPPPEAKGITQESLVYCIASSAFPQNTRQVLAVGRKRPRSDPRVTKSEEITHCVPCKLSGDMEDGCDVVTDWHSSVVSD